MLLLVARFGNQTDLHSKVGFQSDRTNHRETPTCFARDDTAGAGLGQPEQVVVDGFARSAPNLCDRSREWDRLETTRSARIPWAAVALNGELRFTIGEGADDDRYIYRYTPEAGFSKMFACPEFTGSYLSFDGKNLYMSQWYKKRVLMFDDKGNVIREINVGAEICGHTFANGSLYVLRGQEQPNEDWRIARLNPQEETPTVEDIAVVPFASRSLTFDGEMFWSNYRAKDTIISFALPNDIRQSIRKAGKQE